MMKKIHTYSSLLAFCLLAPALGQVVLQDSYAPEFPGGPPSELDDGAGPFGYEIDVTDDFSAAGHGKLIMVYSSKDEDGGDFGGAPVDRVTYAGVPLVEAFFSANDADRVTVGIYYLDKVASDGVLRIELADGQQSEYGFGLYAVDGLKPEVQSVASGAGANIGEAVVTVTTDTGFVVQEAARNNQSLSDNPDDAWETLYNYSAQSYRGLSQYQITTEPGDYSAPINNGGVRFRLVAAAAFEGGEGIGTDPVITSLTSLGENLWELKMNGFAETNYEFYSSPALVFDPGTLVENLAQGDPADPGTIGGPNNSVLTTNADGEGTVQLTLSGNAADFLRARSAP